MPIYEGYCKNCDQKFEVFIRSFHSRPDQIYCPKCQNPAERLFSIPIIRSTGGVPPTDFDQRYEEMHYHEKRKEWEKAAQAAEGVNEYARDEFIRKAKQGK